MSEAVIIRFPVERRQVVTAAEPEQLEVPLSPPAQLGVGGSNFSFVSSNCAFSVKSVTFTGVGSVEVVGPQALGSNGLPLDISGAESWWARVPGVEWAKIGFFPVLTAKQHKLLSVVVHELGSSLALVALAACGRRGPLSARFDENVSGGLCRRCTHK